jgi:REP-associated tyrosine transposase
VDHRHPYTTLACAPSHGGDRAGVSRPLQVLSGAADEHFLTVARYVERNALRAKLVSRAEDWQWSSGWRRAQGDPKLTVWLSAWPVERPRDWVSRVNRPQTASELEALRVSVRRGRPFGEDGWVQRMAKRFGMEATLRPRGRPRGS